MILLLYQFYFHFFFSSRRRHTRFDCDWSSDVCSSDLAAHEHVVSPHDEAQDGDGHHRIHHHAVAEDRLAAESRKNIRSHAHRGQDHDVRSEEHTSELQSQSNLVCRLLLEKTKQQSRTL